MSRDHTYRRPAATSRPALSASRDTKEDILRLDAQLLHLTNEVLPKAPYLISIPSDVPYRHNSRFVNNWHIKLPFTREEEPLQYMSFLTHQGEEQSLIKAVGGWSDDKGNLVEEEPSLQQTDGSNSPFGGGQRKKITLNDYKTKAKEAQDPDKKDGMGQSDRRLSKSKESQVNGTFLDEVKNGEVKTQVPLNKSQERKRSFNEAIPASSKADSPKPEKRARTRSPVRAKSPRSSAQKLDAPDLNKNSVPSLLSPTLPPADGVSHIPELLSPTLPASIEDLLALDNDQQKPNGKTNHQRSDSVRSILGTTGVDSSPLSGSKKGVIARTDHERHLSPSLQVDLKEARNSPGARGRDSTSSPGPRQRHVIVLKYGKRNKKRVEALLKFAPRSKKQTSKTEPSGDCRSVPLKGVNGVVDSSQERAHNRERDGPTSQPSEPPSKRPKITPPSLNLSEKSTTPVPPPFKSPLIQNSFPSKSAFSTPKKELKTTAMRRVESSDGLDARTPTASVTRQSTPASTEKPPTSVRPSSPSDISSIPSNRDDLRRTWRALNAKYFELGRSIKHEGSALLQQESPESKNRGILLTIEALLCFMLNQTALSHANNGADNGWRTVLPYLAFVLRISSPHPHLQGLVSQLGAVCRQIVSKYDLERLAREPLPDDHNGSAPTPGSDGNTKSNEDVEKARRRWNTFRTELTENAKELQRAWLDGYQKLSPEALKQEFPDTWARRARDSSLKSGSGAGAALERLNPENLAGRYFLPLDVNTGPVEAVRYARGILAEWAGREVGGRGPKWKSRIEM